MEKAIFIGLGVMILVCLIVIIKAGMVYATPQDSNSIAKAKKQIHLSGILMLVSIIGLSLTYYLF